MYFYSTLMMFGEYFVAAQNPMMQNIVQRCTKPEKKQVIFMRGQSSYCILKDFTFKLTIHLCELLE